jgi:hypothetical protein
MQNPQLSAGDFLRVAYRRKMENLSLKNKFTFGIDEAGELYVTSKQDGKVRKIIPSPESPN